MMKSIFPIICLFFFAQCSAQNTTVSSEGLQEILNLSYLSKEEIVVDSLQQLNLVLPQNTDKPPLFIWVGGGAWSFVNRHQEMNLARQFAHEGVAVASVGHRLSSGAFSPNAHDVGVQHPAHVEDLAAAFHWLKQHADEYGYDADRIFVGGFSSGAHLAALLASDGRYLGKYGYPTTAITAILPIAGAYDIADYYSVFKDNDDPAVQEMARTHVMDVFGPVEGFEAASPATYIDQLEVPMLLVSEGGLYNYTKVYEEMLWESDYRSCQIFHVFDKDHAGLWRDISTNENSLTRQVMLSFIRQHG